MGQTLSEPVVDKNTAHGEDERLMWGVSEMQGWRLTMEDAHAHILELKPPPTSTTSTSTPPHEKTGTSNPTHVNSSINSNPHFESADDTISTTTGAPKSTKATTGPSSPSKSSGGSADKAAPKTSFFAVYDGHGGSTVARFAGDTVHHRLAANGFFSKGDWEAGMRRAFLETDEDLRANPDFRGDPSGCTAVAVLFTDELKMICANSGDSRAVMSLGGEAKAMSHDHKPTNAAETSRIVSAGGFVEFGRVNGNLALSRALGDFEFKQNTELDAEHQIVTADPDIIVHEHTEEDEFLVIACDGIWDVLTSQQVIDYVRRSIADRKELHVICEELMDRCLAPDSDWGGVGCDNMTAMVVAIKGKRTKEEWYDWVADRVDKGVGYKTPKEVINPFAQGPKGAMGGPVAAGTANKSGGAPGSLSFALKGGHGEDDSEDDEGGDELDVPTIQAALRAQGIIVPGFGNDQKGPGVGGEDEEDHDVEMKDHETPLTESKPKEGEGVPALVANGKKSTLTTSMSPPNAL